MSFPLPNPDDPSDPGLPAPLFADVDAVRGDQLRAFCQLLWGNFAYIENNFDDKAKIAAIAALLTGFATGANSTILATDTVLQAFAKAQGQIDALAAFAAKFPAATSYAPTFGSDMGIVGSIAFHYLRLNTVAFIYGSAQVGTVSGGTDVWFSLPSGLNLKTSKIVSRVTKLGEGTRLANANIQTTNSPHLCYDSALGSTKLRITFSANGSTYDQNGGTNFNNNDVVNFVSGPLPIDEWGG